MHIELDDDLVAKVDELAGPRGRSAFVRNEEADAVRQLFAGLDVLPSALGAIGGAAGTGRAPPAAEGREPVAAGGALRAAPRRQLTMSMSVRLAEPVARGSTSPPEGGNDQ